MYMYLPVLTGFAYSMNYYSSMLGNFPNYMYMYMYMIFLRYFGRKCLHHFITFCDRESDIDCDFETLMSYILTGEKFCKLTKAIAIYHAKVHVYWYNVHVHAWIIHTTCTCIYMYLEPCWAAHFTKVSVMIAASLNRWWEAHTHTHTHTHTLVHTCSGKWGRVHCI